MEVLCLSKVLLIFDCDECPYFSQFVQNRRIQCEISEDEYGGMVQIGYGKSREEFEMAMERLYSNCPLASPSDFCDDYCKECDIL